MLLAKDTNRVCVTRADFFFTDGDLAIVTGDEDGVIRIYEYNPQGDLIHRFNDFRYLIKASKIPTRKTVNIYCAERNSIRNPNTEHRR